MRYAVCGLMVLTLLAAAAPRAAAKCGDQPGDLAAVSSVVGAIVTRCECCTTRPPVRNVRCALRIVALAVREGTLPRRCARTALRQARLVCRHSERPCVAPTTTTTLPRPACATDADCEDGNPCTADACVRDRCIHQCQCVGPGGGRSCCPGPAAECQGLHFYYTCGYPVCRADPAESIPGVPPCTAERAGEPCADNGKQCDPGVGCGVRLLCIDHDPARVCPISERRAKRDISYLTPDDVQRLHDELMRLRLATYQYRSEGPSAPRRLGFVIDDVGQSPAVAPGGSMVDVYAYASMAVAAIQAQSREIDELRHQVEALRRQCRAPASASRAAGR